MLKILTIFLFSLLFICTKVAAQSKLDSLIRIVQKLKESSEEKADLLYKISAKQTHINENEIAFLYADSSFQCAKEVSYSIGIRKAMHLKGLINKFQGNYEDAIILYKKVLELSLTADDTNEIASIYNNIGISYGKLGTYDKAQESFFSALEYSNKAKNKSLSSKIYNSIGNNYKKQSNYNKALEYHQKSLQIKRELNNRKQMASSFANLANVYKKLKDFDKADLYLDSALLINREENNLIGISNVLMSKANMYGEMGDSKTALKNLLECVELNKTINRPSKTSSTYINIAIVYFDLGQYAKSIEYNNRALEIAKKIKSKDHLKYVYIGLKQAYEKQGKYKLALEAFSRYSDLKDSMFNENSMRNINELEAKYNNLINAKEIAELNEKVLKDSLNITVANNTLQTMELEAERSSIIQALYAIGLICALILGAFIFRGYRNKIKANKLIQTQKELVEHQKLIVEIKNKEITDSINYAKRIQSALLPSDSIVKRGLPDSFILYKPKDIVAGDFYWIETIQFDNLSISQLANEKTDELGESLPSNIPQGENIVLFAAADCTGHGVPGAIVSVVCNNSLNRSVKEYGLIDPGEILDKTREIILEEFAKSDEEMKDGMDIALCSLTFDVQGMMLDERTSNLKPKTIALLQYSGALNPLWIIRNGKLIETKGSKQPIGKFDNPLPFKTHSFELEKNDTIYIFSDGYVDQFGGSKGKKLKSKTFKELLLSVQDKTMGEQKSILDKAFEDWRGNLEQIDDVCIIGVRV